MDVELALGAHLDIPSTSELTDGLSGVESRLAGHIKSGNSRMRPIYRNIPVQGVTGANVIGGGSVIGPLPIKCAQGRMWNIVQILLMGGDDHTPVLGAGVSGAVYCGDASVPDLTSIIDFVTAGAPAMQTYSTGAIWCGPETEIFAILYGASAQLPVTLVVRALDYPDSAVQSSGVPPTGALGQ